MTDWKAKAEAVANETRAALQIIFDALNHGQKKKIVKDEKVQALFDFYGINYEEE